MLLQAHDIAEVLILQSFLSIALVAEDHDGRGLELRHGENILELLASLLKSIMIGRIDQENYAVDGTGVFAPRLTGLRVTAEIVRVEADIANGHLGLMRMLGRVGLRELVLLQHVQQRGLSRIVETEEDYVGALVPEAEPLHCRAHVTT